MTDIKPRRIITKPQPRNLSEAEKRKLELSQLETRYKSSFKCVSEDDQETIVQLIIVPSDPDFIFDVESLTLQLNIPASYPTKPCTCQVFGIPKGSASYIEKGYHEQFKENHQTLVRQMNWLDRHMQTLLQQEPTCEEQLSLKTSQLQLETKPKEKGEEDEQHSAKHKNTKHDDKKKKKHNNHAKKEKRGVFKFPKVTNKDIMEAERIRKPEFKQIESRFSDTGFKIIKANPRETVAAFVLKIHDPKFKNEDLISGKKLHVQYHISVYYPIVPCSIEIQDKNMDQAIASAISLGFNDYVIENNTTLNDNLNWLSKNISKLIPKQDQVNRHDIRLASNELENIQISCLSLKVQCAQCDSNVEIEASQLETNTISCSNCQSKLHCKLSNKSSFELRGCKACSISAIAFNSSCKTCKSRMKDTLQLSAKNSPITIECTLCRSNSMLCVDDLILSK